MKVSEQFWSEWKICSLSFPCSSTETQIMVTWSHLSNTMVPFEPTARSGSLSPLRSNDDWLIDMPKNFSPGATSEAGILYGNGKVFILLGTALFGCTRNFLKSVLFNLCYIASKRSKALIDRKRRGDKKSRKEWGSCSLVSKWHWSFLCLCHEICRCSLDHYSPTVLRQPSR